MAYNPDNEPKPGNEPDDNAPTWRTNMSDLENSFNAPSAKSSDLPPNHPDRLKQEHTQKLAGDTLKNMESGGGTDAAKDAGGGAAEQLSGGYREEPLGRIDRALRYSLNPNQRKRLFIGGAIGGGIAAALISAFLALVPLKIVGMMDNLKSHYFASSESAVSNQTDNLFNHYVKKHLIPSLNRECPSTRINKSCIADIPGNSKTENLYRAWKDARLENKLAQNYGIEFEYRGDHYNMKVPGEPDTRIGTDFTQPGNTQTLKGLTTAQVRSKYKEALEGETRLKRTMYRFKVGRLLERKYNIKRCVVACEAKDNFNDWKGKEKLAAKNFLVERVIAPNSEAKGLVLQCVLSGGCDAAGDDTADGGKRDQFQQQLDEKLKEYGEKYGTKAVQQIIDDSSLILDKGFAVYMAEKVTASILTDAAGVTAGTVAEKGIPIIGWINASAKIINTAADLGPSLKKWSFVVGSTAMVAHYQTYLTHADELKNGRVTAELAGSFTSALDSGQKREGEDGKGAVIPGGAAEDSPLYADIMGTPSKTTTASLWGNPLTSKASAAVPDKCDDGNPIPVDKLICPEESLVTDNLITGFSAAFDVPPLSLLKAVAGAYKSTIGVVFDKLNEGIAAALKVLPGYNQAVAAIGELTEPLVSTIANKLLPSPISTNMSGHRNWDMMAGGASAAGSAYAEEGIGGQVLTDGQVAEIRNEQKSQAQQEFNRQPFFARMFDTKSKYSLLSRTAMAMPTSTNTALKTSFASFFRDPFSKVTQGFAMIMSPSRVFAAVEAKPDAFGIPQFGYALNDSVFSTDPSIYTEEYCRGVTEAWQNTTTVDPNTGMDVHTATNPCLLNNAAVAAAGGYYTTSVLDQGDVNIATGGGTSGTGGQGPLAPGALAWPVDPVGSNISSCYGPRWGGMHKGVDISLAIDKPVYASADGEVSFAGYADGYGPYFVIIKHRAGLYTSYGHMNGMIVKAGDTVKQGQQIGINGSQGQSTGPHVHFNVTVDTDNYGATFNGNVDPLTNGLKIPEGATNGSGCATS